MKTIALVAHDHRKADLIDWIRYNAEILCRHRLVCTGTTGQRVREALASEEVEIRLLRSGPLGGDQQLGAMIAEDKIDILIFFWDPMEPQPHEVDVKALLRIAVLYNVPTACNRSTADYMFSSKLLESEYAPVRKDYSGYLNREMPER